MPLPWLIGAAAVAAATAIYNAVKDDDSNDSYDSREEERRREAAAKERQQRERKEKLQAAEENFKKQGRIFGQNLARALPTNLIDIHKNENLDLYLDIRDIELKYDNEEVSLRDSYLFASIDSLETIILDKRSQEEIVSNLIKFSELYKPNFEYGQDLKKIEEHTISLDKKIQDLKNVKHQLMELKINN